MIYSSPLERYGKSYVYVSYWCWLDPGEVIYLIVAGR